jgi:hypothetical protein
VTDRLDELLTDENTPTDGDWDARDARNAFRELIQPEVEALRARAARLKELVREYQEESADATFRERALVDKVSALEAALVVLRWWLCDVHKADIDADVYCMDQDCQYARIGLLRATLEGEATG